MTLTLCSVGFCSLYLVGQVVEDLKIQIETITKSSTLFVCLIQKKEHINQRKILDYETKPTLSIVLICKLQCNYKCNGTNERHLRG